MRKIINTNKAPAAVGPYSQAILHNDTLFVSGQLPIDPTTSTIVDANVKAQTKKVLENLQAVIEAADMSLANVIKCSCFLKNMNDFAAFNEVYTEFFGNILPARECIEVARLPKDVLVEVSAICGK